MIGRIVEIAEDGRYLHVLRGFLVVKEGDAEIGRVPLDDIAAVIGNAHGLTFSQTLLAELASREIPLVVCANNHQPVSILWPVEGHHRQAARMDAQLNAGKPVHKRVWQQLVRGKLAWQADTLRETGAPPAPVSALIEKVRSGDPDNIEAQAARRYWPLLFGADFRRDTDLPGLNALLNYGYAVLRASTARAVIAAGLHPGLGVHHQNAYNCMRLVDDLMEPYRGCVDREVWHLHQRGTTEVNKEAKRQLAMLMYQDFTTDRGTSPLMMCIERLATSLAKVYLQERDSLDIALPDINPTQV